MKDKKSSSKKTIMILLGLVVAALLVYAYIKGSPDDSSISLLEGEFQEISEASVAGARVLTLLSQLKSIDLNTTIFDTPAYRSLVDYTIAIPEQSIGRADPFAPIGR